MGALLCGPLLEALCLAACRGLERPGLARAALGLGPDAAALWPFRGAAAAALPLVWLPLGLYVRASAFQALPGPLGLQAWARDPLRSAACFFAVGFDGGGI